MKKLLTLALTSILLLAFCFSCQNEESPAPINRKSEKVTKVVFSDLRGGVVTTLNFQYAQQQVQTIKWRFYAISADIDHEYFENRFYSVNGTLDSLSTSTFSRGQWNLSYEYKNGVRYRIVSKKNNITSTTTFAEYNGTRPAVIEDLFKVYGLYEAPFNYPYNTHLKFDVNGNPTSQKHTRIPGYPDAVFEKATTYTTELNPLRGLIETPLPQLFEFYDDLGFYYSTHLPSSTEANYPFVDPIHNRITFEYEKDIHGRVILIKASSPDDASKRYTLEIAYENN